MTGAPIKFRCYRCNQLLGVSRAKVGSVVACPKCATDLLVPDPGEAPPASGQPTIGEMPLLDEPAGAETTPASLSRLDAGLPIEIADIRPEGLRYEPDLPRNPPDHPWPTPPPASAPEASPGDQEQAPTLESILPKLHATIPDPAPVPDQAAAPITLPISLEPVARPVAATIKVDPPSLALERSPVRSRDLILPRSVVASWSLFVLLAQAMAFVAGLLAGHFIWRVH